jgi:hypothetical protein
MTMEEDDLRWAIHNACRAIFLAYGNKASQGETDRLVAVLKHLDQHAASLRIGSEPMQPENLWKS